MARGQGGSEGDSKGRGAGPRGAGKGAHHVQRPGLLGWEDLKGFGAKSHGFNSGFQEPLWPAVQGDRRETSWN